MRFWGCLCVSLALATASAEKKASDVWGLSPAEAELRHGFGCMCLGCQEIRTADAAKKNGALENGAVDPESLRQVGVAIKDIMMSLGVADWSYRTVGKSEGCRVEASFVLVDGRKFSYRRYHKYNYGGVPSAVEIAQKWLDANGHVKRIAPPNPQPQIQPQAPIVVVQDPTPRPQQYPDQESFTAAWVSFRMSQLTPKEEEKISHSLAGMKGYQKRLAAEAAGKWRSVKKR